ncbi:MAG: imidazole glycerol phosphate synthase subunit HisF [Calditrichaeota bacterium]|nr:MAG: imidazole glycerol phosphate synthase subunit HisF [Calditrichota bacterium]
MLVKRIIPCLDVTGGRVVKGVNFVDLIDAGDPVEQARFYNDEGADELIFLDITASSDGREILLDMVRRVAESIHIPFTVGGGIRSVNDMREILRSGADKISINTSAIKNPLLITQGAKAFGSQCIVVAIDAKRKKNSWDTYTHGGRHSVDMDAIAWAKEAVERGAGELLVTSMDCDGTQKGFDNELLARISEEVSVPIIASGGAGTVQHFVDAIEKGKADAVLAASLFHFRKLTIREIKEAFIEKAIPARTQY